MKKTMKKSTWVYLTAFTLALLGGGMAVFYVTEARNESKVVVVSKKIPAYTQITKDDISIESIPVKGIHEDSFNSVEEVMGKFTSMTLEKDSQVRKSNLVAGADRPAGVLAELQTSNSVLISVPLQKNDLGSAIFPGDYVNVVGFIKDGQNLKPVKVTNRRVIKIDQSDKNTASGPSIWIEIPEDQSQPIEAAIIQGTVRAELLPKGEGR